jgi:RimJ/RimL family protein N-acetyltransferase
MDDVWPVMGLCATAAEVVLRPVVEAEFVELATLLPDDYELDPTIDSAGALPRPLHLLRTYWRDQAVWRTDSWKLHLVAIAPSGRPIGMQTVEAEDFTTDRTVDSASWVTRAARRRGFGAAMRGAMLALAFDGLGARRAITSAWQDNTASLAVSRRLGYEVDHVEQRVRGDAQDALVHLQLSVESWRATRPPRVALTGVEPSLASFGL